MITNYGVNLCRLRSVATLTLDAYLLCLSIELDSYILSLGESELKIAVNIGDGQSRTLFVKILVVPLFAPGTIGDLELIVACCE